MNRQETDNEKLERQLKAIADLRLDQEADEETQRAVIVEAVHRATKDSWPEMPEDERNRVVEAIVNFEGFKFQWAIFRRGWTTSPTAGRIAVDPETAGPRILARAYATAEADSLRMRIRAGGQPVQEGPPVSLEERLRRHMHPEG